MIFCIYHSTGSLEIRIMGICVILTRAEEQLPVHRILHGRRKILPVQKRTEWVTGLCLPTPSGKV